MHIIFAIVLLSTCVVLNRVIEGALHWGWAYPFCAATIVVALVIQERPRGGRLVEKGDSR
jgi:hypothetical protein